MAEVRVPTEAGDLPAALALPDGRGRRPAVVVIHELFGLNDDIRSIATRFATAGYVAVAPDFMAGLGPRTPLRATHSPAAAEDAWRRVLDFFGRHLAPASAGGSPSA